MLKEEDPSNTQSSSCVSPQAMPGCEDGKKCLFRLKTFLGFFYIFLSSGSFLLSGAIIHHMTYINGAQLSSIRSAFLCLACLPIMIFCVKDSLWPKGFRTVLLILGILTGSGLYFQAMAYRYLPLVEFTVINATSPAFMTVAARIYLKERCGIMQNFALLLTFSGVLVSVQLPEIIQKRQIVVTDLSHYILGICFAFLCVLFIVTGVVTLGKLRHMHFTVPILYSSTASFLISGIVNSFVSSYEPPLCGLDRWMIILMVSLYFVANCTFVLATQLETMAVVVILKQSCEIVLSVLVQIFIFDDTPSMYNICGGLLVLLSAFIISARKILGSMPDDSKIKQRCKFLLI